MASQITSFTSVYSIAYSGDDQRNIKAPRHWPSGGEYTGHRWIPRTKGQSRGKSFHVMTSSWDDPRELGNIPINRRIWTIHLLIRQEHFGYSCHIPALFAYWDRYQTFAILQTTFSNAFYWIKNIVLLSKFRWSLFLWALLIISHHWFRYKLVA